MASLRKKIAGLSCCIVGFAAIIFSPWVLSTKADSSQTGSLYGYVKDLDGNGIPEAKVKAVNNQRGVTEAGETNEDGRYEIRYCEGGDYTITASKANYTGTDQATVFVRLTQDREAAPTIILKRVTVNRVRNRQTSHLPSYKDKWVKTGATYSASSFSGLQDININQASSWASLQDIKEISAAWQSDNTTRKDDPRSGERQKVKLSGRVVDQARQGLVNVTIRVVNETSQRTEPLVLTNEEGKYQIHITPPGKFTITFSLKGFEDVVVTDVEVLSVDEDIEIEDITLLHDRVSSQTAKDYNVLQLNRTSAARTWNFVYSQIEALPLGGGNTMRSFDELALLVPGVVPPPNTPGVRGPGVGFGIGTAGQFSVNGLRARSNNFTIDGSDNNDPDVGTRRQGFVAVVPQPLESIADFSISTLLWDAELGRNFGAQINAVSKFGSNQFRGQIYGFFTDSTLNARNFFDQVGAEDSNTRTLVGFAIGGRIVKDKTHFFASFEHQNINSSTEQHFSTPTAEARKFAKPEFTVLPFSDRFPAFAGLDFLFGQTFIGRNFLSLYPLPNNPTGPYAENTYTEVLPSDGEGKVFSYKMSHQIREDRSISGRYNFTDDERLLPSVNRAIRSTLDVSTRTQDLSLIMEFKLGPRFFNQLRMSYGRTRLGFSELPASRFTDSRSSLETVTEIGGKQVFIDSTTGSVGELIIEPFSPVGVNTLPFPQRRASNTFQVATSNSYLSGNHSLQFGSDLKWVQLNSLQDRNYRPMVVFGSGYLSEGKLFGSGCINDRPTCFEVGDKPLSFLSGVQVAALGMPSSVFQTITLDAPDSTIGLRMTEYSLFINDTWRALDNLTLDYGMRYDYTTVPYEVNRRIEKALALENLPQPGHSLADSPDRLNAYNKAVAAYRSIVDGRNRIYNPDRNNFGPHFGFAWSPDGLSSVSIRGGYGIYYDAILGTVVSQSRNVFPNEIPISVDPSFLSFDVFTANLPSFLVINKNGVTGEDIPDIRLIAKNTLNQFGGTRDDFAALIGQAFSQSLGGGLAFTLPAKNLRTPYAQQWHLTVEAQPLKGFLFSAAYVGTKGTKLTRFTTPNGGPNATPNIPLSFSLDDIPTFLPIIFTDIVALTDLRLESKRQVPELGSFQIFENSASSNYNGLQVEAQKQHSRGFSFTIAYTWSHAIDYVSDIFPIAGAPIFPQNSRRFDLERADASFDVRHRFAASVVYDIPFGRDRKGNWLERWLGGWQVASIFQAHTGQPFTLNLFTDANLDGNISDRPSTTEGLIFLTGHGPRRVAVATGREVTDFFVLGRDGFVGRNTVRGDSFINWDVSLKKAIHIGSEKILQLQAESFNLLNRANFGLPIRVIGAPGFGSAIDTVNPARMIQIAVKLRF